MPREEFDVVFYAPWASSLVGGANYGGAAGGTETQLLLLARGLAARRVRVAMVVIGRAGELASDIDGVRIVTQRPRRGVRRPTARAALAVTALAALTKVRARVVVHMNAGPTTAIAALAARARGTAFVYSCASVRDFAFPEVDPRRVNVALFLRGIRAADEIVVQDSAQAELCRSAFRRNPVVIGSLAERAEPRTASPEAFLWVGRLQAVKRPERYLDLAAAVPEARFWMIDVPQEDEPAKLRRMVEDAAARLPNLELLPPRSRAGVGELIDRSVAIVSTSTHEGLPNVFLEAWSRGVPALSLSFDPEGVIERERLGAVCGGESAAFAEVARLMWHERNDQAELAARCIDYVRREHDPSAVTNRWMELLGRFGVASGRAP